MLVKRVNAEKTTMVNSRIRTTTKKYLDQQGVNISATIRLYLESLVEVKRARNCKRRSKHRRVA